MDASDIIRLMREVQKAVTRIGQASGAVFDASIDLACLLSDLEPELAKAFGKPLTQVAGSSLSLSVAKLIVALARISPEAQRINQKHWAAWHPDMSVNAVYISRQPDGSAIVTIDGKKIRVPPVLGDLVAELVEDNGAVSPDDLIPFKQLPDLALKLQKLTGRPFSVHGVNQLIYRLRNLLQENGCDRFLVQTNCRYGARIALRRKTQGKYLG